MLDEPIEYGIDRQDYDPIDPKLGYYYLWDELRNRIHISIYGESAFSTWERARFVRSCTTLWPFLRIRRCWVSEACKELTRDRVAERRSLESVLFKDGF